MSICWTNCVFRDPCFRRLSKIVFERAAQEVALGSMTGSHLCSCSTPVTSMSQYGGMGGVDEIA